MNLLSPGGATSLFHADIETGKVVREFKLEKDGVEVPMRDIANDSRGAQVGYGVGGGGAQRIFTCTRRAVSVRGFEGGK